MKYNRKIQLTIGLLIGFAIMFIWTTDSHANQDCSEHIKQLKLATSDQECRYINTDWACYGHRAASASPAQLRFDRSGDQEPITEVRSLDTYRSFGAALMRVDSWPDPLKLITFGDSTLTPKGGYRFVLKVKSNLLLCEQTPSGMVVRTETGKKSRIRVNGVTIHLRSAAFVTVREQQNALFSDDPRNNRRNVNAYFCSGFESECSFANCAANRRLLWGPYCRQQDYPYIEPGLYRVSLAGSGRVRAGATDFGSSQSHFGFGSVTMQLPNSYTFCWPGRAPGGYGFETIVMSTGTAARVDHVEIEYLGSSCATQTAVAPASFSSASLASNEMLVTNMEGGVTVEVPGIRTVVVPVGQQVRIPLAGDETPTAVIGPEPGEFFTSPVARWAASSPTGLARLEDPQAPSDQLVGACGNRVIEYGTFLTDSISRRSQECLYQFNGRRGENITVRMAAAPTDDVNPVLIDAWLDLRSPGGRLIASNDDENPPNRDSGIRSFTLPETGLYTIVARSYRNDSVGRFRLSLARNARSTTTSSASLSAPPSPLRLGGVMGLLALGLVFGAPLLRRD